MNISFRYVAGDFVWLTHPNSNKKYLVMITQHEVTMELQSPVYRYYFANGSWFTEYDNEINPFVKKANVKLKRPITRAELYKLNKRIEEMSE